MTGPAVFSDPIAMLVGYLGGVLVPVPVSTRVADPRPLEFVQIRRVGGAALLPVRESVRVDVWVWAGSEARAQFLASQARAAVWALAHSVRAGVTVYVVGEFLAPRMLDDPETGLPRVWATYELVIRADPIVPAAHPSATEADT